ncbi:MAG: HTH domain-containing protein [Marinovum sp.]|nr:HTH domain-containing protein [Marinovum sp.]
MAKSDRLTRLMSALERELAQRAEDLAKELGVTPRTIYRDMESLRAAGVDITGTRGQGYRATHALTLPPVSLSEPELEALYLGLAIIEAGEDAQLATAARTLSERLDQVLPQERSRPADLAATARIAPRNLRHLAPFRAAIRARQKLQLRFRDKTHILHPESLSHWGRLWTWKGWSETSQSHLEGSLDDIQTLSPMPELFIASPLSDEENSG